MDDLAIQGQDRGEYGLIAFSPMLLAIANGLVLLPGCIVQKGEQPFNVHDLSAPFYRTGFQSIQDAARKQAVPHFLADRCLVEQVQRNNLVGHGDRKARSPLGVREPQWLGTKYTARRKGEEMKGG